MDAVARSRQRDAGLSALLERRQSHRDAGPRHSDDDEVRPVAIFPSLKHPAAVLLMETARCWSAGRATAMPAPATRMTMRCA